PASVDHMMWFHFMVGEFDQAEADARSLAVLDPGYVTGFQQLADVEMAARRWGGLRTALEQESKAGGAVDPFKRQLVDAAEKGRNEEGVRLLKEIEKPADPYAWDWAELASWYVAFGRRDEAFARLDTAFTTHSYRLMFAN